MLLDRDLADSKLHAISESDYNRFRDGNQAPVAYRFIWNGSDWDFAFAGPYGFLYAFVQRDGHCFAQKTDLLNPADVRLSIRDQVARPDLLKGPLQQRLKAIAAAWTSAWRRVANERSELSHLDLEKYPRPVSICASDEELLNTLTSGNEEIGALVARENMCFVALAYDGPTWGVIKEAQFVGKFDLGEIRADPQLSDNFLASLRNTRAGAPGRTF